MHYSSPNEAQTMSIARQLATMMKGGEIVVLRGDLGAGKTTFTKGFAAGLGVAETITSPTFSLMNVYPTHTEEDINTLVHIDTYRLETEEELRAIGVEDYLGAPKTVVVLEWPEKVPGILRDRHVIEVKIEAVGTEERKIEIEGLE